MNYGVKQIRYENIRDIYEFKNKKFESESESSNI